MKKSIKPIVISALMAVSFGATAAGTTFALFTDRADTKIEVTAGVVDINTELKLVKYENIGSEVSGELENATKNFTNETEYETEIGTTFEVEGQNLTVTNMVPGDKLTVSVALYNKSNVKTKYRLTASNNNGALASAIKTTVTDGKTNWTPLDAYLGTDAKGGLVETAIVTLEFVEHGEGEILAKEDEDARDNQRMGQKVTYTLSYEVVQGNAHVTDSEPVFDTYVETVKRPASVQEGNPYEFETTIAAGLLTVSGMSEDDGDVVVSLSSDDPTNYTFEAEDTTGTTIKSYDVNVTNFDEDYGVEVSMYVGTGLSSVKVYHTVEGVNELVSPVDYSSETGYVSFVADSFSPYHFVLRAPKAAYVYDADELEAALADVTITDIYFTNCIIYDKQIVLRENQTLNIHLYEAGVEDGEYYVGSSYALYNMYQNGRIFTVSEGATLNVDGGMLLIPSNELTWYDYDNPNSWGFFKVEDNATLNISNATMVGDTDDGAFIRVGEYAGATVKLDDVAAYTNYRVVSAAGLACSELTVKDSLIHHSNKDVRGYNNLPVSAFYLDGFYGSFVNTEIYSDIGSCVEVNDAEITFEENYFTVLGTSEQGNWNNTPIAVEYGGEATINSGVYDGRAGYGAYIFSSGGKLNINGGTFVGEKYAVRVDCTDNPSKEFGAIANLKGGNFYGALATNGNPKASLIEGEDIVKKGYSEYEREFYAGFVLPMIPTPEADL